MFYEVMPEGKVEVLTYHFDGSLLPGQIVLVPIGKRQVPGVVLKKVAQPEFKTKAILQVLYTKPLPVHLLKTIRFLQDYYLVPAGMAVSLMLPRGVQKKRRKTEHLFGNSFGGVRQPLTLAQTRANLGGPVLDLASAHAAKPKIQLNPAQKIALEGLQKAPEGTKLLFGVTGSGKTNIYLQMALNAFKRQKSSIVLVPEIALTSQFVQVFAEVFGKDIILVHSKQTEAERHLIFETILAATTPKVIIGPRSALFAPVADLGLIIIDEEHESTYYQENTPKYSAVRVASFMARELSIPLVLGSATPTVEDFYLAKSRQSLVLLKEKAKNTAKKPEIHLIDLKNRENFTKNRYFADALIKAIAQNLKSGQQTLIFHNRRGSAPLTICEECGEEILCPNCFLPLTLHADQYTLQCHTCGFNEKVPTSCPKCGHPGMVHKGFGTKLLETELKKLFPEAKIQRFDADNKKTEGMEAVYHKIAAGAVDILVGTQTLAKGLDLPKLATVGVVQADAGLALPDFAAEERTFQLLTQVIGRVGRGHLEQTSVFIQTFRPAHPILSFAMAEDYLGFYEYTAHQRQKSGFPPFKFIARIGVTLKTESLALKKIRELAFSLAKNQNLLVSPPEPAFHERTSRGYTWQITVRARSRKTLLEVCKELGPGYKVSLDPPSLL